MSNIRALESINKSLQKARNMLQKRNYDAIMGCGDFNFLEIFIYFSSMEKLNQHLTKYIDFLTLFHGSNDKSSIF